MPSQEINISLILRDRPFILDNRPTLHGLLSDFFANDEASVTQIMAAYDKELVKKIISEAPTENIKRAQLQTSFEKSTGYSQEIAKQVIDAWLSWLTMDVIGSYQEYKKCIEDTTRPDSAQQSFNEHDIYIPCAFGKTGKQFVIRGIVEGSNNKLEDESIYAITFNYLLRSGTVDEINGRPIYFSELLENGTIDYSPDFKNVFRLMVLLLSLVKEGYSDNGSITVKYDGDENELELAIGCLNNYLNIFSRIAGIKRKPTITRKNGIGPSISLYDDEADIYISEDFPNEFSENGARPIWFAKKVIYHIGEEQKEDLRYVLNEISPYKDFNQGQFEALAGMLNCQAHSVCIMPTGSGKSLVFYLMAILQPNVTFVVAPTDVLIDDQIDNLRETHNYDNVKKANPNSAFADYSLDRQLIYLTPETFQSRDLLKEFVIWNHNKKISAIVLDEVHCLSNWSHDFRPEYLMLSRQLSEFLDRTYFKGFTATANYSVMKDIIRQLNIKYEAIYSPVELKRDNLRFSIQKCDTEQSMIYHTSDCLKEMLKKGRRVLVFTKSEEASMRLLSGLEKEVKYETAMYSGEDKKAYRGFAKEQFKILITTDEIGVGINLNNVQVVIHFGLPVSKGEYVQQIGRAGRNGSIAYSYVFYLDCNSRNVDGTLLHRDSSVNSILDAINSPNHINEYVETYRKLLGDTVSPKLFYYDLDNTYSMVKDIEEFQELSFSGYDFSRIKKCLYILYVIGFLNNWSLCGENRIAVRTNQDRNSMPFLKEHMRNYLSNVGNQKKYMYQTEMSRSIEDLLRVYIDWYYEYFIYYHREQFLESLTFFENCAQRQYDAGYHKEITDKLSAYFSLNMLDIRKTEEKYQNASFREIVESVSNEMQDRTRAYIENLNDNKWNVKYEWLIVAFDLVNEGYLNVERLIRITASLENGDIFDWMDSVSTLYGDAEEKNKLILMNSIEEMLKTRKIDFSRGFDAMYRTNSKDIIYYAVLAKRMNEMMR